MFHRLKTLISQK